MLQVEKERERKEEAKVKADANANANADSDSDRNRERMCVITCSLMCVIGFMLIDMITSMYISLQTGKGAGIGYGMTEACATIASNGGSLGFQLGSVGKLLPYYEGKVKSSEERNYYSRVKRTEFEK